MSPRRIFSAIALAALLLGPVPHASAAEKTVPADDRNWYWASQQRQAPSDVTPGDDPVCPPQPAPCPDPQTQLSNPHEIGALPVQVQRGADEKVSAIAFDIDSITPAEIHKFSFTIIESQDPRDVAQTVNTEAKIIQACKITASWSIGEGADLYPADAPAFDKAGCIDGKRNDTTAVWTFDITKLAKSWGNGADNGVMLVGKKPPQSTDTWQIVLKGPRRDDATTPNANEEKDNAKNVIAKVSYTKKQGGSGSNTGTFFPTTTTDSGIPSFGGSTDPGTADFGTTPFAPGIPPTTTAPSVGNPSTTPTAAGAKKKGPELPPIVWIMIPLSLLALSLVRNVVLEPLPGKRADGVVALIRNHNAARLGRPPADDAKSPFHGVTSTLGSVGSRIRGFFKRVITGGAS